MRPEEAFETAEATEHGLSRAEADEEQAEKPVSV